MKRKKLLLIVGAGVLLVAAVLAVLALTVWSAPGKEDFQTALTNLEAQRDTTDLIDTKFQAYLGAVSAARDKKQTYQQIVAAVADERREIDNAINQRVALDKKLEDSKVQRDDDVKKMYAPFAEKEATYVAYVRNYVASYPALQSSFNSCSDIYRVAYTGSVETIGERHKTAAADCLNDLSVLEKVDGFLTPYAAEFSRIVGGRQKVFDSIGIKNDNASLEAASKRIGVLGKESTSNDPVAMITEARNDASFKDESTNLLKLLKKKATQN